MSLSQWVRRGFTALSTPLLPDDYTVLVNPLWSARELRGRIIAVNYPADDVAELVIRRGWGVPSDFHAGQHIGIGVRVNGQFVWRSYSLTCPPGPQDGNLVITVKAIPDGRLSTHLVAHAHPGSVVRLAAPAGDFHLPEPVPAKLLFITAGTGITPVMSMLRHLAAQASFPDVIHLHSARTDAEVLYAAELHELARQQPGYDLRLRITSTEGRLRADDLPALISDLDDREVYACGPTAMLDDIERVIPGAHSERFTLDRGSTTAAGGVVSFPGRGEIEVDGATTILEAGEKAGIQLPYGCRMGICATCVRQLDGGTARDLRTGNTHEAGDRVRVCVTVPAGDVVIAP
ncbi:ferredoxin reductase [Corynebacterium sp. TAE3-ERU12]|uniref:ferredoxin reductase n=1 Tax=Corynebacterium sp. TAE3-ERU12 TaxID=2849491 RepID=UPI001C480919|nr:ferredoxin reductase [Corynebacterium sp. TAE3-ERU12]MBV7294825.1 ferredoxin reductase [Corynebacterium sp. TAE3-ERU12]